MVPSKWPTITGKSLSRMIKRRSSRRYSLFRHRIRLPGRMDREEHQIRRRRSRNLRPQLGKAKWKWLTHILKTQIKFHTELAQQRMGNSPLPPMILIKTLEFHNKMMLHVLKSRRISFINLMYQSIPLRTSQKLRSCSMDPPQTRPASTSCRSWIITNSLTSQCSCGSLKWSQAIAKRTQLRPWQTACNESINWFLML